jgi:hypothetical protein
MKKISEALEYDLRRITCGEQHRETVKQHPPWCKRSLTCSTTIMLSAPDSWNMKNWYGQGCGQLIFVPSLHPLGQNNPVWIVGWPVSWRQAV